MKGVKVIMSAFLGMLLCGVSAWSMEVKGSVAGDAADTNLSTYHFDTDSVNFQMTKPDNTALQRAEVPSHYGTTIKILNNEQDYVEKLALKVEGASLTGSYWDSVNYPEFNTVAIDPASGRLKFSPVGVWQGAQIRDNNSLMDMSSSVLVNLAMNDSGYAICVYVQEDLVGFNRIWANVYQPASGWYGPVTIDANVDNAYNPQIVMNNSGQAMCVFEQRYGSYYRIWANRYTPGGGWLGAEMVSPDIAYSATDPAVAMNSAGQAVCAYIQGDGTADRIYANRYVPATGWSTYTAINAAFDTGASVPKVAINTAGNAICVFRQPDGGGFTNVYANRYLVASDTWQGGTNIDNGTNNAAYSPRVTLDDSNNAVCVFNQDDGSAVMRVYANIYTSGSGWMSTPQILDMANGYDAYFPEIASNSAGQALCTFSQAGTDGYWHVYAQHYSLTQGWYSSATVSAMNNYSALYGVPVLNNEGRAICTFSEFRSDYCAMAAEYIPGSGWQDESLLSLELEQNVWYNQDEEFGLALNNAGQCFCAFIQATNAGYDRLLVNEYKNAVPYGSVSVNYYQADPVVTPTPVVIPDRSRVEVTGRKIEPLQGERTTITYDLAKSGQVTIKIYNLRGELVKTLIDQYQSAGSYQLIWAAENTAYQTVASGVYVIHIKTPSITKTQKVVVIK